MNDSTCLAVGRSSVLVIAGAGATWQLSSLGTTYDLHGITCAGSRVCLAVGTSVDNTNRQYGAILASGDGGHTCQRRTPGILGALHGIACIGSDCVAVGEEGSIVVSNDGGATWLSVGNPFYTISTLYGVTCTGSTCLAVGEYGTILASSDDGTTWRSQSSGTTNDLNGVTCPTSRACLVVGNSGTILAGRPK